MKARRLEDAQHEAAHVVVGVSLGLRLRRAALTSSGHELGYALFTVPNRKRLAWAITLAAGVAYERRVGAGTFAEGDLQDLREHGYDAHEIAALVVAADAILETRRSAHSRVARALLQRDLTREDVEAIARGERTEDAA